MSYQPKHAAPGRDIRLQRTLATGVVGAAALGTALVTAPSASAAPAVWDRVAQCESGGNWSINTGNGYYGGLQFSYSTWKGFGGQKYGRTANLATKAQQIEIAQKVLKVQGPGAWPVCSKRAGLTRENGLGSGGGNGGGGGGGGSTSGKLVVDGVRGYRTNAAIERWVGGSVNGSLSSYDIKKLQSKVGASADGVFGPQTVKYLQKYIGMKPNGSSGWDRSTVKAVQTFLNNGAKKGGGSSGGGSGSGSGGGSDKGSGGSGSHGKIAVDGVLGPQTAKRIQTWLGVTADGSLSSSDIKKLQAKVKTSTDGVIGPHTTLMLQKYIGMKPNGARHLDSSTVRALQAWLNKR